MAPLPRRRTNRYLSPRMTPSRLSTERVSLEPDRITVSCSIVRMRSVLRHPKTLGPERPDSSGQCRTKEQIARQVLLLRGLARRDGHVPRMGVHDLVGFAFLDDEPGEG